MLTWLRRVFPQQSHNKPRKAPCRARLQIESLEDRRVMSVTYHGGALLPHVEVQGLYVGNQWSSNPTLHSQTGYLEGFLSNIVDSTYMDALTNAGYGVGRGSASGGKISLAALASGSTLNDSTLRSWLGAYAGNGTLKPPDANRLYVCFIEPNVIMRASDGSTSVGGFRGYHGAFSSPSGVIRYAVMAYPRGTVHNSSVSFLSDIDSITKTASHEIAEAVTDPNIGYSTLGWYDDTYDGEIADIKNDRVMYINGYAMQRVINKRDFIMTPAQATSDRAVSFVLQNNGNFVEVVSGVPTALAGTVVSMSDQGIDNQGHAMVDIVVADGRAWEFHDQVGWTYLGNNIKSAVAGQGVSYILYNDGTIREYDDATGSSSSVYSWGTQISAGTDVQGVNTVDIVFTWGEAWQHSDDSGWDFIASGVKSISAGRQGISDYLTTGGVAHWHSESGSLDVTLAGSVKQVTAGTDKLGNYMIDLVYTNGNMWEYRVGSGWDFVWGNVESIGKARDGVVSIVFNWDDAYDYNGSSFFFLTGSAQDAA
jgi:hypothetical protein